MEINIPQESSAINSTQNTSLGSFLSHERTKKNISLEDVAESTCIHITTLRAIESDDRSKMPAEVFLRGFVKLYAEFLGLNVQDIMDRYNNEMIDLGKSTDQNHNEYLKKNGFKGSFSFISMPKILLLIVFLLLVVIGYWLWSSNNFPFSRQSRSLYFEKYYVEKNSTLYAAKKKRSHADDTAESMITSMH